MNILDDMRSIQIFLKYDYETIYLHLKIREIYILYTNTLPVIESTRVCRQATLDSIVDNHRSFNALSANWRIVMYVDVTLHAKISFGSYSFAISYNC